MQNVEEWESGSVGGFQVFTDADQDGEVARKEAEVYLNDAAGGRLISVSPGANVLSIVLCEPCHVEFVRYVSAGAPGEIVVACRACACV